ncbi:hypothetical protein K504DRAFT_446593 [Pleomassaria siparia CBS 279.74]|uniref:Uncharacterized protein n=1 Tax=Pleomassaria siparia CBS 279.74 TaxID=1314801 RepID=A0A6G1KTS4_9PLEO|nr:hypothetical protein K504DRAFT_446593 [Pleomassaria siparia CBS 279.74]
MCDDEFFSRATLANTVTLSYTSIGCYPEPFQNDPASVPGKNSQRTDPGMFPQRPRGENIGSLGIFLDQPPESPRTSTIVHLPGVANLFKRCVKAEATTRSVTRDLGEFWERATKNKSTGKAKAPACKGKAKKAKKPNPRREERSEASHELGTTFPPYFYFEDI